MCCFTDLLREWRVLALRMIHSRQSFLLAVNGHVLVCAETFMRGLSACIFDIHQPDVVALKARLTGDGKSDADIEAMPSKYFRDRYLAYTNTLHMLQVMFCSYSMLLMQQCHVFFLEHTADTANVMS